MPLVNLTVSVLEMKCLGSEGDKCIEYFDDNDLFLQNFADIGVHLDLDPSPPMIGTWDNVLQYARFSRRTLLCREGGTKQHISQLPILRPSSFSRVPGYEQMENRGLTL